MIGIKVTTYTYSPFITAITAIIAINCVHDSHVPLPLPVHIRAENAGLLSI